MSEQPSRIPAPTPPATTETGRSILETALNEATVRGGDPAAGTSPVPAAPGTPAPAGGEPGPAPGPVPYDRFTEVNERAKRAEAEAAQLRKEKEDREAAELSEIERANKAKDEAEQRAQQAERRALELERTGFIRQAALDAKFTDPEDAVAFLAGKLDEIDSAAAAKAAVERLAAEKKHLVAGDQPAAPTPIGGLTPTTPPGEMPVGPDGKPDVKAGLGRDLLSSLTSRKT